MLPTFFFYFDSQIDDKEFDIPQVDTPPTLESILNEVMLYCALCCAVTHIVWYTVNKLTETEVNCLYEPKRSSTAFDSGLEDFIKHTNSEM